MQKTWNYLAAPLDKQCMKLAAMLQEFYAVFPQTRFNVHNTKALLNVADSSPLWILLPVQLAAGSLRSYIVNTTIAFYSVFWHRQLVQECGWLLGQNEEGTFAGKKIKPKFLYEFHWLCSSILGRCMMQGARNVKGLWYCRLRCDFFYCMYTVLMLIELPVGFVCQDVY
jgi:hypothetical protein